MSKRPDKNLIVGLDIGTSKVVAIVGEVNEEGNIEECLETVVANDPEEIVVIDGGSTDRTVEIARAIKARVLRRCAS